MIELKLEIEKGGQSDQLAKGLKISTQTYGENMIISAGTGAADVVASTGVNIGVGSTDQIILDNTAAGLSLTGIEGLTNLAKNLEGYTQQLTAIGLNAPNELVEIILDEITKFLAENGVIDNIKKGMQVTQNTVELTKMGLKYATSIATVIENIQKLLLVLNKMQDIDIICIPSVKDSLTALTASFINQLQAQYNALKQQLIIFYNSMICTSNDTVLDNIVVSVNNILEVIEPALEPMMQKYTGYTLQEIRNICNQGFAYIGMIQRAAAKDHQQNEQLVKVQEENFKKQLTEEEKIKQQLKERSKRKWEQKTIDLPLEQAREKLLIWIGDQPIMLQNAFHILIIKDLIDDIKRFISQMQNTSIDNQMELLNTISNILEIFEYIGLTPDAKGLTLEDLKLLNLAIAGTAVETTIDIGNQVQNNAQQYTDQMIREANAGGEQVFSQQNVIANAKGTLEEISETAMTIAENNPKMSTKEYVQHTAAAVGQNAIASGVDQVINNVIDAGLSMDMRAIANGNIPTVNTDSFTYTQTNENKNIYINITINKNPSWHLIAITSFIKSFKSGSKDIFNNGATKQIKDAFKAAWETNDIIELKLQAIVNRITKFYIFTFEVNQDARKNPEKYGGDIPEDMNNLDQDTENKTISLGNNAKNKANNTLNNVENEIIDAKDKAISQLTKTNININADMIESVLYDSSTGKMKVLMLDEIIQYLKILQPAIEVLKVIAHILENYMINKEFVRTKQHSDLANALRNAAQLVNGLKDIIDLKNTNFFIIRTKKMADWALKEFNTQPDETGFIIINILQTTILNTYCTLHAINPDYPLNLLLGTTIYFDGWAIENGGYKDGTSNGLDNIEINRDLGEVYYDKKNRSTISSEILRARKKGVNPKYVKVSDEILKSDKNDINSLLQSITFSSDEFEGQQTLSIGDLDLCSPTVKDRNTYEAVNKNAVIVEFGDEYTLGSKVEYSLTVKPGQSLKEGDILGYIKKDNELTPIRTQYTGVIRSIDIADSNYSHIYPSAATRHIIIDNPQKCSASNYDINDIMSLQQNFKKATELEALIINCMPLSILPSLLNNADRTSQISTSYTSYNEIIKNYDSSIIDFADKLKQSSKNFKSNTQTSSDPSINEYKTEMGTKKITNISLQSVNKIKDDMLNDRKLMVEKAISVFNDAIDTNVTKVFGDNIYLDCVGLAYSDKEEFERSNKDGDTLKYNNYYINLLKSIPPSSKQYAQTINVNMSDIQGEIDKMHLSDASIQAGYHVNMDSSIFSASNLISSLNNSKIGEDEGENRIDQFKQIINDIIDIRLAYEKQTNISMINVFNTYYQKNIKELNDPYNELNKRLEQEGIDKNDADSILKQIKLDKNYIDATFNNIDNRQDFDNEKNEVCQQALTLFMYLINANITKSKSTKSYEILTITDAIKTTEELYINNIKKITYNNKEYTNFNSLYDNVYKHEVEKNINNEITVFQIKENTIIEIVNLLKDKNPKINRIIVERLIEAHLNDSKNLSDNTRQFFEDVAQNNLYYQMLKDEAQKLEDFWKEVINEYRTVTNLDNAINAINNYANRMNQNVNWPQGIPIKVANTNYELFTFTNPNNQPKKIPNQIPYVELDTNDIPKNPEIDLTDNKDIRENDQITIFDYEYWVVYMLNATMFTLFPIYWADGFDIPPYMTPIKLPAIYFPIATPVMVPIVNVLMVFGIALRGIWPAPIILMINLSSDNIDVMIFIKIALEIAKDIFKHMQNLVENGIPMIANEMLMEYLNENEIAQKSIEKFRTYSSIIKAIPIEDKALIEKKFNEALQNELNKQTKMNEANAKLQQTQDNIKDANRETQQKVNQKINELNKKQNDYIKNYDRRQVITRESDLGNGPEPM